MPAPKSDLAIAALSLSDAARAAAAAFDALALAGYRYRERHGRCAYCGYVFCEGHDASLRIMDV